METFSLMVHNDLPIILELSLKYLISTGALPLVIIILMGEDIFKLVFGEKWAGAGQIAEIIIISSYMNYITNPLSSLINIAGKQDKNLALNIILLIAHLGLGAYFLHSWSYRYYIWTITILYCANYFAYLFFCWRIVNNDKKL